MNHKLETAQQKFIGNIGELCDSIGFNKLVAQLYALLYLSNRPLSLDEMAEALRVSKGSVSLNIRELEKWAAVRNIWMRGSRKDYYEADLDVKKLVLTRAKSSLQRRISAVTNMVNEFDVIIRSAQKELGKEEENIAKVYRERMKKISELKNLAVTALNFADKFLV